MPTITQRLQNAWNAFRNPRDPTTQDYGRSYAYRPDRYRIRSGNERSIVTNVFNRIAVDCAAVTMEHVKLDQNGRYKDVMKSRLNNCLTLSANLDQTGRAFIQDAVHSMFDEGVVALIPVVTVNGNPWVTGSYDVETLRTGKIVEWFPHHIRVRVYNEDTGQQQDLIWPKEAAAIVENPFYSVMNEPNSTLQRLIRKLNLLDYVDEQSSSGKLDLIIQLPYVIKSTARRQQAEMRRKDIEMQLAGSKYGIAYTDGTEKVTQLNRSIENNIWTEVKDLTTMLYSQLGITETILNGTADEQTMINYYNNTIEPVLSAFALEMQRKFLTPTARTQGQAIRFYRDAFKLIPIKDLAELADKFTRNEIASSNEIRSVIGWKPSDDPKADMLVNANLNQSPDEMGQHGEMPMGGPGGALETATTTGGTALDPLGAAVINANLDKPVSS